MADTFDKNSTLNIDGQVLDYAHYVKDSENKIAKRVLQSVDSFRTFYAEVSKGNILGHSLRHIFSHNHNVTTTIQDVWKTSGDKVFLTVAATLEAISDSVDDTLLGTGTRVITVNGLDENFLEISEDINLNGLTATIATTKQFIRVNSVEVKDVGIYGGSNVGNIIIRVSGGGVTQAEIGIDNTVPNGKDFGSHYCVPAGKTGYILKYEVIAEANKTTAVHFMQRLGADIITAPFTPIISRSIEDGVSGSNGHSPVSPERGLPEKSDVWFKAVLPSGTGAVTINYELLLIDN